MVDTTVELFRMLLSQYESALCECAALRLKLEHERDVRCAAQEDLDRTKRELEKCLVEIGDLRSDLRAAEEDAAKVAPKFDVRLVDHGPNKIEAIRRLREFTGCGLREAKDAVESAPSVIISGVRKSKADQAKRLFEAASATVEVVATSEPVA